jgi:septal ring factor EnvC (AmiA/AmiB activator)
MQVIAMDPWLLIVLLGGFTLVCGLLIPRRNGSAESGRNVLSMQNSLEQFMENMEADNKDLVNAVTETTSQQREDNAVRDERIMALERRCQELEQTIARSETRIEARLQSLHTAVDRNTQPAAAAVTREVEKTADADHAEAGGSPIRTRYTELFNLHESGKSIEIIAKKMGMNKGEVMLILQLSKQEEEYLV